MTSLARHDGFRPLSTTPDRRSGLFWVKLGTAHGVAKITVV